MIQSAANTTIIFSFKDQPDLNWRNPEVKQAMFDKARFWLDKGVDGFRLDAIGTIFEDPNLPYHFPEISQKELYRITCRAMNIQYWQEYYPIVETMYAGQHDLPEIHDLMCEFRQVINEYTERVLVGESDEIAFYGKENNELHLNFNFPLMRTNRITPACVRANQNERLIALPPGPGHAILLAITIRRGSTAAMEMESTTRKSPALTWPCCSL